MKKMLITLHRWLGFPLGLLFLITFGTGFLTAIDELLERSDQASFNDAYVYQATSIEQDAAAISQITKGKKGISRIIMPAEDTPYYQLASREESWTFAIDDLTQSLHSEREADGFFHTVLQLHRNFLLGREGLWDVEGKYYAAWVSLGALLLSLLGLWVWWPLRKSFKPGDMVPRGKKRKHFYYSHMTSGVIVLIAIVLLSLTGAAITYREIAKQVFSIAPESPALAPPEALDNSWAAWLSAAYAKMPEGSRLVEVRYPRQSRGKPGEEVGNQPQLLNFRFATPDDWFGLTRSGVKIDRMGSKLVEVNRFAEQTLNEKLYSLLKPLHTGQDLPIAYVFLLLFFSFIGTLMVFSGLFSFMTKKRKRLKFNRPSVDIPMLKS